MKPGPLPLVIVTTNLKSIVGKYRGRGPGPERGRKEEKLMAAQID